MRSAGDGMIPAGRRAPRARSGAALLRFSLPIPGKRAALVSVPASVTADDAAMLAVLLEAFLRRAVAVRAAECSCDSTLPLPLAWAAVRAPEGAGA